MWLIRMCGMTHSYVRNDSFICVAWLTHMCDMTRSYVWHDSFICATWPVRPCPMTHSYVRRDSFVRVSWLIRSCVWTNASLSNHIGEYKSRLRHTATHCNTLQRTATHCNTPQQYKSRFNKQHLEIYAFSQYQKFITHSYKSFHFAVFKYSCGTNESFTLSHPIGSFVDIGFAVRT